MLNKKHIKNFIFIFFAVIILLSASLSYILYNKIFVNNISENIEKSFFLYIPSNANFATLADTLQKHKVLKNFDSFKWVAEKKNYINRIKSGRYELKKGMNNNDLVNMLRSGNQSAIRLTINNVRTKDELATKISNKLELSRDELLKLLNDKKFLKKYEFKPSTVISMFIPNTYQFYWNTSVEKFFEKMNKEYVKFWTKEREQIRSFDISLNSSGRTIETQ